MSSSYAWPGMMYAHGHMQGDPENSNAVFQVASNFNAIEARRLSRRLSRRRYRRCHCGRLLCREGWRRPRSPYPAARFPYLPQSISPEKEPGKSGETFMSRRAPSPHRMFQRRRTRPPPRRLSARARPLLATATRVT